MIDFVNYKIMRKNIFRNIFDSVKINNKNINSEKLILVLYF